MKSFNEYFKTRKRAAASKEGRESELERLQTKENQQNLWGKIVTVFNEDKTAAEALR